MASITDIPGAQSDNSQGYVFLVGDLNAWKTEDDLGISRLEGRSLVKVNNTGVTVAGKHTDADHTLDVVIYSTTLVDPTGGGKFSSILKFGNKAFLVSRDERLAFRSNTTDGTMNIEQYEV